jgi:hypothetical protein
MRTDAGGRPGQDCAICGTQTCAKISAKEFNMRIAVSLRNLSLGAATASFLLAGSALAQSSQPNQLQHWQMKGVNARLDQALDVQSARVGQTVEVKLDQSVNTANGAKLPAGTEVWGKVEKVETSQNGAPSLMTLRFTTAALKNGQKIPVKVTVIGAYPASAGSSYVNSMGTEIPPVPSHIRAQDKFTQEPGLLHHIEMKSSVQAHNSATFTDRDGNVKLNRGTYLQLAIAPRSQNGQQQSGM